MSGSRGDANFVWRCKSCKVLSTFSSSYFLSLFFPTIPFLSFFPPMISHQNSHTLVPQRESTATIKTPPTPYKHSSPPTKQNILEFDCRGLEFTAFKSDVCLSFLPPFLVFHHILCILLGHFCSILFLCSFFLFRASFFTYCDLGALFAGGMECQGTGIRNEVRGCGISGWRVV